MEIDCSKDIRYKQVASGLRKAGNEILENLVTSPELLEDRDYYRMSKSISQALRDTAKSIGNYGDAKTADALDYIAGRINHYVSAMETPEPEKIKIDIPANFSPVAKIAFVMLEGTLYKVGRKIVFTDDTDDIDYPRCEFTEFHDFENWLIQCVSEWILEGKDGEMFQDLEKEILRMNHSA